MSDTHTAVRSDRWFYIRGDQQVGPVTLSQLIRELPQLPDWREAPVWRSGFANWKVAREVQELAATIPPPFQVPSPAAFAPPSLPPDPPKKGLKARAIAIGSFIAVLFAAAVGGVIGKSSVNKLMEPSPDAHNRAIYEGNLRAIQNEKLPKQIDNATTLARLEAEGPILRYFYIMDDVNFAIPGDFAAQQRPEVIKRICASQMINVMKNGAIYQYNYADTKNQNLGSFSVAISDCR